MDGDKWLKFLEERNGQPGFISAVGFRLTELREGYAKGELVLEPKHGNPIGSTHGGVLFTIADTVGGAAATSYGQYVTTISGNINYINAAMGCKKLIAESVELKVGKKTAVYDVIITDETGKLICKATMTYFRLPKQVPTLMDAE